MPLFRQEDELTPEIPGNIDLFQRPVVELPGGGISTVRSMSVNVDGREVLIPTVSDEGRLLSPEEAVRQYQETGKHLGIFSTPEKATAYARKLHEQQERLYGGRSGWEPSPPQGEVAGKSPAVPKPPDLETFLATPRTAQQAEQAARVERLVKRLLREEEPPVERSLPGEALASLGRGVIGLAKVPFAAAKIVGADILGSQGVRRVMEPVLFGLEEMAESRALRPSTAVGKPIELDRILEAPEEVARQIRDNVTDPRFWAAQLPEAAVSMAGMLAGNIGARLAGQAFKYGKAMKAVKASEYLTEAEKAAKLTEIGEKLARLGTIGGYGAAMAMEAAEAESRLRQWEDQTGKRVDWFPRVASILGSGLVSGGFEALSFEKIFMGKHGAPALTDMLKNLFEGRNGTILVRKILDSVATEGTTEAAQELVQNLAEKYGYNPDKKLTEGIVEAALIGGMMGGMAGGGVVSMEAVRQYAPYIQELKRRAEEERLARLPEGFGSPRTGPTPAAARAAEEAAAAAAAAEAAGRAEEARLAGLPEQSPIYRTGPTPAAARAAPITVERPSVPPLGETEADILREPAAERAEAEARPQDFSGRPAPPPEQWPLWRRIPQLLDYIDRTGDPNAARELQNLIVGRRREIAEAFRVTPENRPTMEPLRNKAAGLYRRVEEEGDMEAARQLHALLEANWRGLTGMVRREEAVPQPMTQSAGAVRDMVQEPRNTNEFTPLTYEERQRLYDLAMNLIEAIGKAGATETGEEAVMREMSGKPSPIRGWMPEEVEERVPEGQQRKDIEPTPSVESAEIKVPEFFLKSKKFNVGGDIEELTETWRNIGFTKPTARAMAILESAGAIEYHEGRPGGTLLPFHVRLTKEAAEKYTDDGNPFITRATELKEVAARIWEDLQKETSAATIPSKTSPAEQREQEPPADISPRPPQEKPEETGSIPSPTYDELKGWVRERLISRIEPHSDLEVERTLLKEILEGYRDIQEAEEAARSMKETGGATFTATGYQINADALQEAINQAKENPQLSPIPLQPHTEKPKTVRFHRGSLADTVEAARRLKADQPLFIFGTSKGLVIEKSPPAFHQDYVVVRPDGGALPMVFDFENGKHEIDPSVSEGMKAWLTGEAYLDNAGNYRLRATKKIAPWNKELKSAFPQAEGLTEAAKELFPDIAREIERQAEARKSLLQRSAAAVEASPSTVHPKGTPVTEKAEGPGAIAGTPAEQAEAPPPPGVEAWPERTTPASGSKEREALEAELKQTEEELKRLEPIVFRQAKRPRSANPRTRLEQRQREDRYEKLKERLEVLRKERYRAMLEDRLEELKGTDELPYIYAILGKLAKTGHQLLRERLKEAVDRRVGDVKPKELRDEIVRTASHYFVDSPLGREDADQIISNITRNLTDEYLRKFANEELKKLDRLTEKEKAEFLKSTKGSDFEGVKELLRRAGELHSARIKEAEEAAAARARENVGILQNWQRPPMRGAWDGNTAEAESKAFTDGYSIIFKKAVTKKKYLDKLQKPPAYLPRPVPAGQIEALVEKYGKNDNPLVFVGIIGGEEQIRLGLFNPSRYKAEALHPLALFLDPGNKKFHLLRANKVALVQEAAAFDEIVGGQPGEPVVFKRNGEIVALVAPVGFDLSEDFAPDAALENAAARGFSIPGAEPPRGKPASRYRLSVAENLRRGREAMERVIAEHTDVPGAMWREDLGDISFYWGKPGDPEKDFRGGYGVSHIIAKRNAEGEDGEAVARKMVEVIAKGEIRKDSGPEDGKRVEIGYENHVAILSKYRFGERETWLLTGWKEAPGEHGEVYGSTRPTHGGPTRFRPSMGAGAEKIISPAGEEGKGPVLTREMVEAAFPGSEVRPSRLVEGFHVHLPNGLTIIVHPNTEISVPTEEELRRGGYSEAEIRESLANPDDWLAAGLFRVIDGGGLIQLAKGMEEGEVKRTLRHETFHAACDLVLTEKERQAVLKEFGDWESAARAYEVWNPEEKPHTLFQKILDFFRRIWEAFRPTWERTFGRIARGEVWRRRPQKADVFGEPVHYRVNEENLRRLSELYDYATKAESNIKRSVSYREIGKEEAERIKKDTGVEAEGFKRTIDNYALRHISEHHGDAAKENLRGQLPVTKEDILAIPEITRDPDFIIPGGTTPQGLKSIWSVKTINGIVYYLEEVRTGKKELAAKTMIKAKIGAAARDVPSDVLRRIEKSPLITSKTSPRPSEKIITIPAEEGKPPKYSIRPKDQETIENYREKHLAPSDPREPRNFISTVTKAKDILVDKAQKFYDQMIDRWAPWERLEARALKAGAKIPEGELISSSLAFMRGVEERVKEGITGQYVYQDAMSFDEDLGEAVFTGDELVRKGPSFNRRLEPLRELARRRGVQVSEVMEDFEVLLVAQRDLELAGEFGNRKPGEIKGVHPEESQRALEALAGKYGPDMTVMYKTADSLREWSDEMILQPLLQVGFIDELQYRAIKAKNQLYAPYRRLLDAADEYLTAHMAAAGVPGKVLKQIRGSEKQILSPLQTWIELAYKAQWAYARNKVYRAAYILGKYQEDANVREVPAKFLPIDFTQKQEIDVPLRRELEQLARELKVDVRVVKSLRGKRLGEFSRELKAEIADGEISEDLAGQIRVRFATTEKTLAHELGHAIDDQYDLVGHLIDRGTPEMRRELRRIADQQAEGVPSKAFKRQIRKKEEQVAEFVNRYLTDRETARATAPETTEAFEKLISQHDRLKPLLTFRPTAVAGFLEFQNRVWAKSPLPPEPDCVPYYRNGVRRWLKLPPELYHAARNLMPAEMGIVLRFAKLFADGLRSGAILVPEFSLGRNPVRDVIQAWIFSRHGFNPLFLIRDARLLIGKDPETRELWRQWRAGGGALATLSDSYIEPEKITAEYLMGKESRVKYFSNPIRALAYLAAYLENLTRFSIYKQAREKGYSHAEAVKAARGTTLDYGREGAHPTARYLNTVIPFFRASLLGMDKLASELTGPNRRAVAYRLGILAGVSVLLFLFARNDDRYQELEDWERNYFWHIPLGKEGPMLRIPKPFEAGILFGSVPERLVEGFINKDIKGVKTALAAAWEAAAPEVIPTLARPYIEAKANYDFFRGRPIEDIGLQRLPAGLRAKPWTTETAKAVGRLLDISPVQLEHFVRQWTGGLGANYFLPGIDLLLRKTGVAADVPKPEKRLLESLPVVNSFFTRPPTGWRAKSANDFFDRYQEVLLADMGWKTLLQKGDIQGAQNYLKEHPEAVFARVARKLLSEMSGIRKERNKIHESPFLTPAQKREKLEALDQKVTDLARLGVSFLDREAAASIQLPPLSAKWKAEDYYTLIAQPSYEAFVNYRRLGTRLLDMDPEERRELAAGFLRRAHNQEKRQALIDQLTAKAERRTAKEETRRLNALWGLTE